MLHPTVAARRLPILLFAGAFLLTACSKSEPPKPKNTPAPIAQAPAAPEVPLAPRKSVDYMAGLKNSRDESKAVTREELERSAKQVVQSAEATKAAAAAKADLPKAPETKTATAPAPAPAPVIQTPPPAAVPAPRTTPAEDVVAKAPPTAAAPAPVTTVTPVTRAAPEFPREAVRSGVESGTVRARLTIDSGGNVTNVQITEARPARIFDRSVRETLSKWKFNNGADGRTYDTEVEFKR